MTDPRKWDAKTIIFVLGFLGVSSIGGLLSQAQRVTGWLAWPAIESAQGKALDSLRAWHREDSRAIAAMAVKVDSIAARQAIVVATISEMPGAAAAARRRRAKEKARREDLFPIDDDRSSFRSLKGD